MQMPYFLLLLLIIHIMLLLQLFIRSIYFIMTLVKQVTVKQHTSLIEYIDLLILKVFVIFALLVDCSNTDEMEYQPVGEI